jgi:hypothetical protein
MAEQEIRAVMKALNLSVFATFVPYSISRNAPKPHSKDADERKGWLSLNWQIELRRDARCIVAGPFSTGSGNTPAAKSTKFRDKNMTPRAIAWECEHGKTAKGEWMHHGANSFRPMFAGPPIEPNPVDVVASLVLDSDVLDYPTFEDWATCMGYDADSRRAEATYRACLETALAIRAAVGDEGLRLLRDACQDY